MKQTCGVSLATLATVLYYVRVPAPPGEGNRVNPKPKGKTMYKWNGKLEPSVGRVEVPTELQAPELVVARVRFDDGEQATSFAYVCKPLANSRYAVVCLEGRTGFVTTMGSEGPVVEGVREEPFETHAVPYYPGSENRWVERARVWLASF